MPVLEALGAALEKSGEAAVNAVKKGVEAYVANAEKSGTLIKDIPEFSDSSLELSSGRDYLESKLNEIQSFTPEQLEATMDEYLRMRDTGKGSMNSENLNIHSNEFYSTYDERIKQTPKEGTDRGEWGGKRGESVFYPPEGSVVAEILNRYGMDGIPYKDGIPDFSGCSEATVKIDNMSENRTSNFRECDQKCAEQWNEEGRDGRTDWTANDVKEWRRENGYSWHERNDMQTCDLVPTEVNDYFGHLGGVSECKKRDVGNIGGDFDD